MQSLRDSFTNKKWYRIAPASCHTQVSDGGSKSVLFDLSMGEPRRQRFPAELLKNILVLPRVNYYYPACGHSELRASVLTRFYPRVDPSEFSTLITHGAINALDILIRALVMPEDEVLIASASFPPYSRLASFSHARIKTYPIAFGDGGFRFDINGIASAITPHTRVLVINSPHNPTGAMLSVAQRDELIVLLRQYPRLNLISDEVYSEIVYDGYEHFSMAGLHERAFVVNSFSKSYSLQGLRLGWIIAPLSSLERLAPFIYHSLGCASSLGQEIALELLHSENFLPCSYSKARAIATKVLDKFSVPYSKPRGSFFILIKVADESAVLNKLASAGIKAVGGSLFGETTQGFIRCCFAQDDRMVQQGFTSLAHAIHL